MTAQTLGRIWSICTIIISFYIVTRILDEKDEGYTYFETIKHIFQSYVYLYKRANIFGKIINVIVTIFLIPSIIESCILTLLTTIVFLIGESCYNKKDKGK